MDWIEAEALGRGECQSHYGCLNNAARVARLVWTASGGIFGLRDS